jgi:Tfp pilus assembly protein PilF
MTLLYLPCLGVSLKLKAVSRWALITTTLALFSACTTQPSAPAAGPVGLADLMDRPAEKALMDGMRQYDDGQYPQAEAALNKALGAELRSPRDRAVALKLLAFIACTSQRDSICEAAFRAARLADPSFALSRSEAGHPLWGPVYRRVVPPQP